MSRAAARPPPSAARTAVSPRASGMARQAGAAALVALLLVQPLAAQESGAGGHRKWLFAAVGAVLFAVPALASEAFPTELGICTSRECVGVLAGMVGGTLGFLIGHERDRSAARRYAAGPTLRVRPRGVDLPISPLEIVAGPDGTIVVGREGLSYVGRNGSVRRIGSDIRGIETAAVLPARDAILAVSASSIFALRLDAGDVPGRRIFDEGGEVIAAVGDDAVVLGGSEELRRLALSGQGSDIEVRETARVAQRGVFIDMAWAPFSGVLWSLSRDRLIARDPVELSQIAGLELPGGVRAISVSGNRGLVAAGRQGLYLLDLSDAARPRLAGRVQGVSFAFDAALAGDRAYVAAGAQGLVILDVSDPARPVVTGVARNLGFVSTVMEAAGLVYTVDRERRRLNVIELEAAVPGERR